MIKLCGRALLGLAAGLVAAIGLGSPAAAQHKLKWAHVYETNEPYHTQALWAAAEIAKRTNNKYRIEVFPASQLGNEPNINEALSIGALDIIYTGVSFIASSYKPISVSNAPYMFRDFDHWMKFRASRLFRDLAAGYDRQTGHHIAALTYYGERHVTANKPISKPDDMRGLKLRVPQAPLYLLFARSVGAIPVPIAFSEVYPALQQGVVDGQENPLPTIMAKRFYEVQSHVSLTGHITESLVTIVGRHVWSRLDDEDRKIFDDVLRQAADRATAETRAAERKLPPELEKLGKTVIRPDREAFRKAVQPLLTGPDAMWSKAQYEAVQAIR